MDRATDPAYLLYQHRTTEKLDTPIEAHQRYSERPDDYLNWVLDHLDPHPGDLAHNVGCGKGSYHPLLIARGVRAILGVDASRLWSRPPSIRPTRKAYPCCRSRAMQNGCRCPTRRMT